MAVKFGPFELEEAARVVMCARQEVPLQPRVFDLLVYLVSNRDRVVSKDELLEAVWPHVTVTDNSLQRAVSALRAALRKDGMDSAIRNVPGKGYRFCIDCEFGRQVQTSETAVAEKSDVRTRARRAAAAQAWLEAATLFENADAAGPLGGEDLHQWALALQCTGKSDAAIPVLVRAVNVHTKAHDVRLAVVDAVTLSGLHFERGQAAIAKGWLAGAEDWASGIEDPATTGRILWMKSKVAAFDGEPEQALSLADAAYAAVRHTDNVNIEALSLAYRGFYCSRNVARSRTQTRPRHAVGEVYSERSASRRFADRTANGVRVGDQHESGQDARHRNSTRATRPRRRGARVRAACRSAK